MDYSKHYDLLIERARNRVPPEGYIERHHVVPRCMGGLDEDSNLVALTPEEHYLAHLLLVKMYPENRSLVYAANKMCVYSKDHNGFRNNKRYGWLKRKFAEARKIDSKGKGNTQYGTTWINKIGTIENKKIKKGDLIPEGWQKGRKLKIPDKRYCVSCNTEIITGYKCRSCIGKKVSKYLPNHKNTIYITNGYLDKRIPVVEEIPEGWRRGRSKGLRGDVYG